MLVDHRGEGVQLAVDALVLLVELGRNGVEAVAQGLRTGQQQLPRGHITGRRGGSLQRAEKAAQGRRYARVFIRQQFVDRADLVEISLGIAIERGGGLQLGVEVGVVHAAHVGQGGAGADKHPAHLLRRGAALDDLLTRIARGIGVGNVVADCRQCALTGVEPRHPDVDQTRHGSNLINS